MTRIVAKEKAKPKERKQISFRCQPNQEELLVEILLNKNERKVMKNNCKKRF